LKRIKRRYLLLQVDCDFALSEREFLDAVWAAVTRLHGEHGASQTGLALLHFDETRKTAMIRVNLTALQRVRASLASITRIADKEAAVHVVAVSGTIKSLHKKT
jgi:RNase P/RNase MRP subunit POP5